MRFAHGQLQSAHEFKTALDETSFDLRMLRAVHCNRLRCEQAKSRHQLAVLNDTLREQLANLETEFAYELSVRRNDMHEDSQRRDSELQTVSLRATLSSTRARSTVEVLRYETFRNAFSTLLGCAFGYLLLLGFEKFIPGSSPEAPATLPPERVMSSNGANQGAATQHAPPFHQ